MGLDGDTFWIVAEHGERASYVKNIRAEPSRAREVRPALADRHRDSAARRRLAPPPTRALHGEGERGGRANHENRADDRAGRPGPTVRPRRIALALLAATLASCGETEVSGRPEPAPSPPPPSIPAGPGELPEGRGYILARVRENVLAYDRPNGTPDGAAANHDAVRRAAHARDREGARPPPLARRPQPGLRQRRDRLDPERSRRARAEPHPDCAARLAPRGAGSACAAPASSCARSRSRIGSAGTTTPPGRFQVTDKLPASRFPAGPYGCCIIALSARQPNLPPGWAGGDRIAIHGTDRPETIGQAASSGCLRATDADLQFLMRDVPVGAPVFIRG